MDPATTIRGRTHGRTWRETAQGLSLYSRDHRSPRTPATYLRKSGFPSVSLPLPVGSRAFLEAYHAALEAEPEPITGQGQAAHHRGPCRSLLPLPQMDRPVSWQSADLSLCA